MTLDSFVLGVVGVVAVIAVAGSEAPAPTGANTTKEPKYNVTCVFDGKTIEFDSSKISSVYIGHKGTRINFHNGNYIKYSNAVQCVENWR